MANLTVNAKKYGQITLNTKPHSDPVVVTGQAFLRNNLSVNNSENPDIHRTCLDWSISLM